MADREIRWGCEQPLLVKSMELIAINVHIASVKELLKGAGGP
jgi:hypothetical protein